jgi:hypothetical protein
MNTNYIEKIGSVNIGHNPEINASSLGVSSQLRKLLTEKTGTLFDLELNGLIKNNDALVLFDKVSKLEDAHCIYDRIYNSNLHKIYMFDHGVIELSQNKDNLYIQAYSTKKEILLDIKNFFGKNKQSQIKSGHVFAIVSYGGRLALSSIGDAGIPLNKINYTDKVNADYEYIIQDLKSKSPSGRIVIFDGEPGTGKTHIIRSLLLNVTGAMFVLVSPDMVSSLSGPELLPLLLTQKQSLALTGPIILLLEDADKCLVTRQSDNMNSIQSLLNLGDGILGSLLDLRIIATTNAKKIEIEPAILRPGRLSKRVEVNALDAVAACKIYKHLLPKSEVDLDLKFPAFAKFSLAHIYFVAREDGWIPTDRDNSSNNEDEEDEEDEEFI